MLVLCLDVLGTVWVLLGVLWRYCVGTVQGVLLSLSGFCGGSDSCSVGGQYELEFRANSLSLYYLFLLAE